MCTCFNLFHWLSKVKTPSFHFKSEKFTQNKQSIFRDVLHLKVFCVSTLPNSKKLKIFHTCFDRKIFLVKCPKNICDIPENRSAAPLFEMNSAPVASSPVSSFQTSFESRLGISHQISKISHFINRIPTLWQVNSTFIVYKWHKI